VVLVERRWSVLTCETLNVIAVGVQQLSSAPCPSRTTKDRNDITQFTLTILATMNRLLQSPLSAFLLLSCAYTASAHGGEHVVVAPDADWQTRHMAGTKCTSCWQLASY
jgi:hypothetical protein